MKRYPYREQPGSVPVFRKASRSLGWNRTVDSALTRAQKEIEGLKARIRSIYFLEGSPEQSTKPIPAAYFNDKVFTANDQVIELTGGLPGVFPGGPNPFNVILADGQTYTAPLQITGPGVFVAEYFKVSMRFRLHTPNGIYQIPIAPAVQGSQGRATKISTPGADVSTIGVDGLENNVLNFVWNLIDTGSMRRLADDLIPDIYLLPTINNNGQHLSTGNLWVFDTPWVFERDSQLTFEFRPITPFLQVDPASAVLPFGFDDREENGFVRNNEVTVKIEIHGTRYLQERDRGYQGAIVTKLSE